MTILIKVSAPIRILSVDPSMQYKKTVIWYFNGFLGDPIDTGTYWYFNQRTYRFFNCTGTYWYLQAQSFACEDIRHDHYQ